MTIGLYSYRSSEALLRRDWNYYPIIINFLQPRGSFRIKVPEIINRIYQLDDSYFNYDYIDHRDRKFSKRMII